MAKLLDVRIDSLTCETRADLVGKDEPNLWVYGLGVDTVSLAQHDKFVLRTDPTPGLIPKVKKGQTVAIPAAVGHIHRETDFVFFGGVLVIGFENDLRTAAMVRDAYRAAGDALNAQVVAQFQQPDFADLTPAREAEIGAAVRAAIVGSFVESSVFLTLVGGKALGNFMITERRAGRAEVSVPIDQRLESKRGGTRYRIRGTLRLGTV
jgi:hypothetical protein